MNVGSCSSLINRFQAINQYLSINTLKDHSKAGLPHSNRFSHERDNETKSICTANYKTQSIREMSIVLAMHSPGLCMTPYQGCQQSDNISDGYFYHCESNYKLQPSNFMVFSCTQRKGLGAT
jgi:hypothetical protein